MFRQRKLICIKRLFEPQYILFNAFDISFSIFLVIYSGGKNSSETHSRENVYTPNNMEPKAATLRQKFVFKLNLILRFLRIWRDAKLFGSRKIWVFQSINFKRYSEHTWHCRLMFIIAVLGTSNGWKSQPLNNHRNY